MYEETAKSKADLTGGARKSLTVFYVLDTSRSMEGAKISMLNAAMRETINALTDVAADNGDAAMSIAVLEFNSGAKWITNNGPESLETDDFIFEDLEPGGITDLGAALRELNEKLTPEEYLTSVMGALYPVIIFMTDGQPNDDWESALQEARQNRYFVRAKKIGFAIGDDADATVIANVVGNKEAVIKTTDLALFRRLLRNLSVRSSRSSSTPDQQQTTAADDIKAGMEELGLKKEDVIPNIDDKDVTPEPEIKGDGGWPKEDLVIPE